MRRTRVGNARYNIGADTVSACQQLAAVVAHLLDAYPLIRGGRIPVINPQKRADFHVLAGGDKRFCTVCVDNGNFARTELPPRRIAEIQIGKAFKADTATAFLFADGNRRSAESVARGINAFGGENQHAHRAVNQLLRVTDAVNEILFLVDNGGDQFRRIDFAVLHFKEMCIGFDNFFHNFIGIVDSADGGDGKCAVMRTDKNGLCLIIRNTADAELSFHGTDIFVELRPKRCVFNVVNRFVKAVFRIIDSKTRAARAQMRVIVHAEK